MSLPGGVIAEALSLVCGDDIMKVDSPQIQLPLLAKMITRVDLVSLNVSAPFILFRKAPVEN